MFRIRRIYDDVLPVNQTAIAEVQSILRERFPDLRSEDVDQIGEKLRNPFKQRFRSVLFVAEKPAKHVTGFALWMHDPELKFCYLDFLATTTGIRGRGIGAALYERVRDEALTLGAVGVFFECLPDVGDGLSPEDRKANAARLRFYEQYGARPIGHTLYETSVDPESQEPAPFLVFDGLGRSTPLHRKLGRQVARAILERKYDYLCPPEYVERVVASFRDEPVQLREPLYHKQLALHDTPIVRATEPLSVFVNDKHDIHHIRERGYVEAPARIAAILRQLEVADLCQAGKVRRYADRHITAVHNPELVDYLRRACALVPEGKSVYPYVFPIRNAARPPRELSVRAGYYCIDTFTPINRNAYLAARRAVDCALSAADEILAGQRHAYALVRPPGHHAESRVFGGFCYFNNVAIAANYLSRYGRVAVLDIDYHHGNGQQEIFYRRDDVLTISLHGDPAFAYPYFTGFADERGEGPGEGFNLNLPLPETLATSDYLVALEKALAKIADFSPVFLVIALGLDPAKGDPTGTWLLTARDFRENGKRIASLGLSCLIVQEGGYRTRTLGVNARSFFQGLLSHRW